MGWVGRKWSEVERVCPSSREKIEKGADQGVTNDIGPGNSEPWWDLVHVKWGHLARSGTSAGLGGKRVRINEKGASKARNMGKIWE